MKRWRMLFVMLAMLLLTACGAQNEPAQTTPADTSLPTGQTTEGDVSVPDTSGEEPDSQPGKILVAWFSATGSTKRAAEILAETNGTDCFAIEPEQPYTAEDLRYNQKDSRVCQEHDDPARQQVPLAVDTPADWVSYDVVFLSYPIWWGGAAWPVRSFVRQNDFAGKTVIPFCTSASSALGSSAADLAAAANGGTWRTGMRFASDAAASDIQTWAAEQKDGK